MATAGPGFLGRVLRLVRGQQQRRALDHLLAHADPSAPLAERVTWLIELLRLVKVHRPPTGAKIRNGGGEDSGADASDDAAVPDRDLRVRVARIRFLLQLTDRHPEWKSLLAKTLRSVRRDTHGLCLFATTGLPQEFGFWSEAARRIAANVLPEPPAFADLAQVFVALFPERGDETMPLALPVDTHARLREVFRFDEPQDEACWAVIRRDLDDPHAHCVRCPPRGRRVPFGRPGG